MNYFLDCIVERTFLLALLSLEACAENSASRSQRTKSYLVLLEDLLEANLGKSKFAFGEGGDKHMLLRHKLKMHRLNIYTWTLED